MTQAYLINLHTRPDRLKRAKGELYDQGIPYTVFRATPHDNGATGLCITMKKLFEEFLDEGGETVLVFEDDIQFVVDDVVPRLNKAVASLPEQWDLLYLGVHPTKYFVRSHNEYLLPITGGLTAHAVLYNRHVASEYVTNGDYNIPFDVWLVRYIQSREKSFCMNPMIAIQRPSYSDIKKKGVNYVYILQRFKNYANKCKTAMLPTY